jgi:hypothetical protein
LTTPVELLARLDALGVSVQGDGGVLRFRPASAIPSDLLLDLRVHKVELLALLAANHPAAVTCDSAGGEAPTNCCRKPPPSDGPDPEPCAKAWAENSAADAPEAPELVPDWPGREHERWLLVHRQWLDSYRRAALRQAPSWWRRAEAHRPTPGATCSCCGGQRWWSEDQRGWRCWTCHPPSRLPTHVISEIEA